LSSERIEVGLHVWFVLCMALRKMESLRNGIGQHQHQEHLFLIRYAQSLGCLIHYTTRKKKG